MRSLIDSGSLFSARLRSFQGNGRIAGIAPGILTVDGVAAIRDVRLVDRRSGLLIGETISAADGTYAFNHLNEAPQKWLVYAFDRLNQHNAVVADMITAVPMFVSDP